MSEHTMTNKFTSKLTLIEQRDRARAEVKRLTEVLDEQEARAQTAHERFEKADLEIDTLRAEVERMRPVMDVATKAERDLLYLIDMARGSTCGWNDVQRIQATLCETLTTYRAAAPKPRTEGEVVAKLILHPEISVSSKWDAYAATVLESWRRELLTEDSEPPADLRLQKAVKQISDRLLREAGAVERTPVQICKFNLAHELSGVLRAVGGKECKDG
jgi:hypothetical protein